jgi:hypothetical protein
LHLSVLEFVFYAGDLAQMIVVLWRTGSWFRAIAGYCSVGFGCGGLLSSLLAIIATAPFFIKITAEQR